MQVKTHQYIPAAAVLWILIPNALNLYPDPEFWPNLILDPGLCFKFWKLIIKNNFIEKQFSFLCWSVESLNGEFMS